ncbi:hypothetical protein WR25_12960 [Diploscapter pachys]|uniref:Uncharacterized protein n=1 Tax=Diploscapter pachys TaxID=2018661 RepID=A0A2A2K325_9BILA|nr:hypothetical protein WR25_12960 [Diploscapter pachys]
MVRVCRVVPKEWTKYPAVGTVIPLTRFIVFKTPLNDKLLNRLPKEQHFNLNDLFRILAERDQRLGLVVDLTDTDRYYDKRDVEGMCIEYEKINCPGRGFIEREECVEQFNAAIQKYIDRCDDPKALIGVHCTHGINRSGYLVCRFLIERLGWSSHEAIDAFEKARGCGIEKGAYVQALHKAAKESRMKKQAESDSDSERKKKNKKRKRDKESYESSSAAKQVGAMIQQFIGQLGQKVDATSSAYGMSPNPLNAFGGMQAANGAYASPSQQYATAYNKPSSAKKFKTDNTPSQKSVSQTDSPYMEDEELDDEEDYVEEPMTEFPDRVIGGVVESSAQKRRKRRQKKQKLLEVMKRGNFHEIQQMREEYLQS